MAKKKKERTRIDFNRIVRTLTGEPYTTVRQKPLRLGKAMIDALSAMQQDRESKMDGEEKMRLDNLARAILCDDVNGGITNAPYTVLDLPERVVARLVVSLDAYGAGMYAACKRLLFDDDDATLAVIYDDIEVALQPSLAEIEQDDGSRIDVIGDDPDEDVRAGDKPKAMGEVQ